MLSLKQYSKEQLQEMSLIEMAYEYLKNSKQPVSFNDLMDDLATAAGISAEQVRARIAQFYTDLNIDGRFISLGENKWGLRVWYPVDTVEEEQVAAVKPKKKKAKKVVDEDLEDFEDLDDDADYDDLDDFADDDAVEEDDDDTFDDIDEVDEFEEEEEEFDLDETEALDDDLDDDLEDDGDLEDDLEESLEDLQEEELADDEDEEDL